MEEAWRVFGKFALTIGIFFTVTWSNTGWLFFLESVLGSFVFVFFLKIGQVFLSFQTDWNNVAYDALFAPKFYFWKYLSYR